MKKNVQSESMPIVNMIELSTAHVSKSTMEFIMEQAEREVDAKFIAYTKGNYGAIFPVFLEEDNGELPVDLRNIIELVEKLKCIWVMLDADGPTIDSLQKYDW